jgi:anti-anti-sigma factor
MSANHLAVKRGRYQGMESIEITGPFDAIEPELEGYIKQVLEEGQTDIVFDLSKTTYLTSPGIGMIIKAIKWFHAVNGSVFVYGATSDTREFFALSRIDTYLTFI